MLKDSCKSKHLVAVVKRIRTACYKIEILYHVYVIF